MKTEISEILSDLKFEKIGSWALEKSKLKLIKGDKPSQFEIKDALYLFLDHKSKTIFYIGKTTQSLNKRFDGYIRGKGKSTNARNNKDLKAHLIKNNQVDIWALLDDFPLVWGGYKINLAAGLEDALIAELKPIWNGGRSESEIDLGENNDTRSNHIFAVKLSDTYFNKGYINPGVKISPLLGEEGTTLKIKHGNHVIAECKIDRRANGASGAVRLSGGKKLVSFLQAHFNLNDVATFKVISKNEITIENL